MTGRTVDVYKRQVQEMTLEDHHVYKVRDLNRLRDLLGRCPGAVIVTTEKDAVKLTNRAKIPEEIRRSIYYLPINISFPHGGRLWQYGRFHLFARGSLFEGAGTTQVVTEGVS